MELSDRIEKSRLVMLEYGPDKDGYFDSDRLTSDEQQFIVNALRQLEAKLALVK